MPLGKQILNSNFSKVKRIFILTMFMAGILLLPLSIYQIPSVKTKFPWLDNQITAYRYEMLAKKLPPDDIKAKRLRAMAEALKKGSKDYQFETGPLPPMGQ